MLPMIFLLCFFVPQTSEETLRGRNNRNSSLFLLFSPLAAKTFDTDGVTNLFRRVHGSFYTSFSKFICPHARYKWDSVDFEISSACHRVVVLLYVLVRLLSC